MGFPISNFSRAGIQNGFLFMGFPISLERWFPISEVSYFAQFPISCSSTILVQLRYWYYSSVLLLLLVVRTNGTCTTYSTIIATVITIVRYRTLVQALPLALLVQYM